MELLVAVVIVSMLAALIGAKVQSTLAGAKTTKCLANMRMWTMAVPLYTADNNGLLPITKYVGAINGHSYTHDTFDDLLPYVNLSNRNTLQSYMCPVPSWSFGFNAYISSMPVTAFPMPGHTVFVIDTTRSCRWVSYNVVQGTDPLSLRQAVPKPHHRGVNVMYLDGHGENLLLSTLTRAAFSANTSLYVPADNTRLVGDPAYDR